MLNHFSNGNKFIAAVEKVISPITKHLGWRTDLSLTTVLEGTSLHVARKQNVNPLRFWALVECVNKKNGYEVGTKHVNGARGGNGSVAYLHSNGYHAVEPSGEQATA
jgi:phosphatidylethanolamine/phosphatidyl-N-methylethanolamine N-methyltransferase